jgi:hypothetical protein
MISPTTLDIALSLSQRSYRMSIITGKGGKSKRSKRKRSKSKSKRSKGTRSKDKRGSLRNNLPKQKA